MNDKRVKDVIRTARAEASAWIVRLHGPQRTPELEAGFRAWLAASPENAREFERVTEVWDAGAIPVAGVPRVAQRAVPVRPQRWLLAAMLALVVIGLGIWRLDAQWLNPSYTTDVGERRIIRLPDGSTLTLNSDSGVVVSYRRSERRIRIERGEAFFAVARNPGRPFRVRAGEYEVVAVGTSFVVRREPQELMVTLVEGKVTVSDVKQAGPRATLTEGQRARISNERAANERAGLRLDNPRIDAITAWLRGELVLDGTTLGDAIAEMNRYDRRRLVIDDPSIAAVRISGVYHTGDSELFANMVARLYGLAVLNRNGQIHLTTTRDKSVTAQK